MDSKRFLGLMAAVFIFFITINGLAQTGSGSKGKSGSGPSGSGESFTIQFDPFKETLDIEADSAPIRSILNGISTTTGVIVHIPRDMESNVTLSFKDIPVERAFKMVLGSSENTVMVYTEQLDSSGRSRTVLSEVQVIGTGSMSGLEPSPRSGSTPPGVSHQNPKKPTTRPDLPSMQERRKKARERKVRSRPGSPETERAGRVPTR